MYDNCIMSKGYPGKYKKNKIIEFKKIIDKKLFVIHAGTKILKEI